MATLRIEVQRKVKEARRKAGGCKECGRIMRCGAFLGGVGLTFSELVRERGATWEQIEKEIEDRGFMCRRCLNLAIDGKPMERKEGPKTQSELLMDPNVRKQMAMDGMKIPESMLVDGVTQISAEDLQMVVVSTTNVTQGGFPAW